MTSLDARPNPLGVVGHIARDIKLSHTVFAMPFALLGAFLAARWAGRLPGWGEFVLVVVCMVMARTFAMTINRWADAALDAANPRTAGRAVPAGRVSRGAMLGASLLCGLGFVLSAGGFWLFYKNAWPLLLSPAVLLVLGTYSYTKRFTWLCHLFLGCTLALSPVAAAIAIEPGFPAASPAVWLLSAMVLCWVAGFDVIYALQDTEHDRSAGLFSMPSRLGPQRALWVSRVLHFGASALLLTCWWACPLVGAFFLAAVVVTIALLVVEHTLVWGSKTNRLNMAFFTVNGVISLLLGAAGILDVVRATR
ncbi:putative 4-hydroxybenzoate polyprenyltransferase [Phycisphaeraceae bacterium D3-23]